MWSIQSQQRAEREEGREDLNTFGWCYKSRLFKLQESKNHWEILKHSPAQNKRGNLTESCGSVIHVKTKSDWGQWVKQFKVNVCQDEIGLKLINLSKQGWNNSWIIQVSQLHLCILMLLSEWRLYYWHFENCAWSFIPQKKPNFIYFRIYVHI